jgi:hypothetical protein
VIEGAQEGDDSRSCGDQSGQLKAVHAGSYAGASPGARTFEDSRLPFG